MWKDYGRVFKITYVKRILYKQNAGVWEYTLSIEQVNSLNINFNVSLLDRGSKAHKDKLSPIFVEVKLLGRDSKKHKKDHKISYIRAHLIAMNDQLP